MENKRSGGLIRISDMRLGTHSDSPGLQRDTINFFANKHGYELDSDCWLELWESAGGDTQPAEKAIEFCKTHDIKYLIVMNISRFTRGGAKWFINLKEKLEKIGVQILDTEGVISADKCNTLEEMSVSYEWSIFGKTEEQELKSAMDARVDRRSRLTQLIKAEIRYARLGYWMYGKAPYGYTTERQDTENGLRWFLIPHPKESIYIKMMFELKAQGKLSDLEIVNKVNGMGFKTRTMKKRHPDTNMKQVIIGSRGGSLLTVKHLHIYLRNPIYAGVLWESRAGKKELPRKVSGTPLLSVELFNKANNGKISISEDETGKIYISKGRIPTHLLFKNIYNDIFPYKQFVLCPHCNKPLHASTSMNRWKNKYSYYHCGRKGHKYFSVKLENFNKTIESFVKDVKLSDDIILRLKAKYIERFEKKRDEALGGSIHLDDKIANIKAEQQQLIEQVKKVSLPVVIKSIESDIGKLEEQLGMLYGQRNLFEREKAKIQEAINSFWYYLEHMDELILNPTNPANSAKLFSLIFEQLPTYDELVVRTPKLACVFNIKDNPKMLSEPDRI